MGAFVAVMYCVMGEALTGGTPVTDTLFAEERVLAIEGAHRIEVTPSGSFLITNQVEHRVLLFSDPQSGPRDIGGFGWGETSFDKPTGAVTDGVNIYIADYGNHRVQRYDRLLNFVSTLSTRDTTIPRARFGYPLGVCLTRQGDLFVLDGENSRIVKFTNQSKFERAFGDVESAYRLKRPGDIAVGENDHILVLEPDQVVEFDFSGNYVRSMGKGAINGARGLSPTKDGFLVVEPNAVLWFDSEGVLRNRKAKRDFLQRDLAEFRDVGIAGSKLFLLTEDSLRIFTVIAGH